MFSFKKITYLFDEFIFTFGKTDPQFKQILFKLLSSVIPDLYFLPVRLVNNYLLVLTGIKLNIFKCYIRTGFSIDHPEYLTLGDNVFLNRNITIEGTGKVCIGNNVQIGPNVSITTSNHDISDNMNAEVLNTIIEDNTWVGACAVITPGVTIGPNVIVGAGAVVTKCFDNCMIAGNPARVIKQL
jgi:acetyltransferase-like isoleucine patch superfamily enzyme